MSDKDWKPKLNTSADVTKLDLSAEEGFLLSRIDGATSLKNLSQLTGMAPEQVEAVVGRLARRGALEAAPAPGDLDVDATVADGAPVMSSDDVEDVDGLLEDLEELLDDSDEGAPAEAPARKDARGEDEDEDLFDEDDDEEAADDDDDEDDDDDDDDEIELDEGNFRKLYAQLYKEMDEDRRVAFAREEDGAKLCALCFDPAPAVIRALMENQKFQRPHARLVAEHHRTSTGISHLARQVQFLSDSQVQRFLLRNPQTPDPALKKMLSNKPLMPLYKVVTSRELSNRAKRAVRQAFRQRWTRAPGEEKVGVIFKTEGRCLNSVIGMAIDSQTAQLIQRRTIHSVMLIQSFARFPGTPPALLQHLFKAPPVKRAPHLKKLILQHPNCPSGLKRGKR